MNKTVLIVIVALIIFVVVMKKSDDKKSKTPIKAIGGLATQQTLNATD